MLVNISKSEFISDFMAFRREQFSYSALEFIYDWHEECQPDLPVDFVGLCCNWTEYNSLEELNEAYDDISDINYAVLSGGTIIAENI